MADFTRFNDALDYDEGGRLHAFASKAAAIDAPVLIVGLGGTGVQALLRTKKLINETMVCDPEDGKAGDRPKNIAYLGIDTDSSSKSLSVGGVKLRQEKGEIRVYELAEAKPALLHPEQLPPYIRSWLDTGDKSTGDRGIDPNNVINGAGAIRQLGRMLLMQNIGDLKTTVEGKIRDVVGSRGYNNKTPLYVFVIAGISGGTGSGTFIDVPYIIRCIANNIDRARPISVVGLLFMPDVNALNVMGDSTAVASLYTNGFAALKELEYLTNIKERHDVFDQVYGDLDTKVLVDGGEGVAPYNICLLMSSKDKNGATPEGLSPKETYRQMIQIAAETVFNFVLGDDNAAKLDDFSIQSYLSNEQKNVTYYRTLLGDTRHPVNYTFSIAGASSAILPMDDVMSYLTYQAFKTVDTFWDKDPSAEELDQMEAELMLTREQMEAAAKNGCKKVNAGKVEYRDCVDKPHAVVALFENALEQNKEKVKSNISDLLNDILQRIDDKNNAIFQAFRDLKRGPVYAQHCIYRIQREIRCLHNDLIALRDAFQNDDSVAPAKMDALERSADARLSAIRKAPHKIFGKEDALQDYLKALNALYNGKLKQDINKKLAEACNTIDKALMEKNHNIFESISQLMTTLVHIFDDYGQIRTQAGKSQQGNVTTFSWQLVDAPTFIQELERYIQLHPEMGVNLENVVADFYTYLFENTDLWTGARNGDMVEEVNDFIYKEFEKILDQTMDQFLQILANAKGYPNLQAYCDAIFQDLNKRAQVHFPLSGLTGMGAVTQPSYSFVSVPNNAPALFAAAQKAAAGGDGTTTGKAIIKQSGIKNRIFMMNFASATPLAACGDMVNFYNAYKVNRKGQNGAGLHLFKGTKYASLDWEKLPSPYPETEWIGFNDPEEKARNDHYREVLRKAIAYGYVVENQQDHKMTLKWDGEIDLEAFAAERGITLGSNDMLSGRAGKEAAAALDALIKDVDGRCKNSYDCNDLIMEEGKIKKNAEEMTFIGLFTIRDEIEKMVKNHEEAVAALEEIKKRTANEEVIENFVACMLYRLVDQDPQSTLDYIYRDYSGKVLPLCGLTAKQNRYKEHYIMMAFKGLPSDAQKALSDEAEARKRKRPTAEELERFGTLRTDIEAKLKKMNSDYRIMEDGEAILQSYQLMNESVQNLADLFGV